MTRRVKQSIEGAGRPPVAGGSPLRSLRNAPLTLRGAPIVRLLALVVALGAMAICATPAQAITFVHPASKKVLLIPQNGPVPRNGFDGIMPISSYVSGKTTESFNQFSFTSLQPVPGTQITPGTLSQITPGTLSQYDTVALIQVPTSVLTPQAMAALAQFVANGGKLLIHDSDETSLNDYSWLFGSPVGTTRVGAGCNGCGKRSGSSAINPNSHTLISGNPADQAYVDVNGLPDMNSLRTTTDAIGDANLLQSTDPHWFTLATGTNANGDKGANVAYAANNNGLIVYNGFDTDYIHPLPVMGPQVDWLANMWYSELIKGWGTPPGTGGGGATGGGGGGAGLPQNKPLAGVGTPLAASLAGLPSNRLCVAGRRLALGLKKLSHLHGRKVVRIDVFVNGKFVRSLSTHFRNVTLKHLPRHGTYTVTVIATTKRGYHLIAHRRYHEC